MLPQMWFVTPTNCLIYLYDLVVDSNLFQQPHNMFEGFSLKKKITQTCLNVF